MYIRFAKPKNRIILISAITTFVIGTDILTGSNLSKTSILGYDAIIGASTMGWEMSMGVFVAVVLLFILPLVQQQNKYKYCIHSMIFIIIIIGMPVWSKCRRTIMASTFIFAFVD